MRSALLFPLLAVSAFEALIGCDDQFTTGGHSEPDAGFVSGASGQAGKSAGSSSGGDANGGRGASGAGAFAGGAPGRGGGGVTSGSGGGASAGGAPAVGGSDGSGAADSGVNSNAGGSTGSGGTVSGGAAGTGGAMTSGGRPASGGGSGSGGRPANGGASPAGGAMSTGGAPNQFPTTAILDNFNRQALGSNWTGDNTSFGIVANHLQCGYCLVPEFWTELFGASQEAFLTITAFAPATDEINVVMKAQDPACNQIEIRYSPIDEQIRIDYCYDGTWRSTASFARTLQPGDRFGGRANANGTVDIFVNGTAVKQYDLHDFPYKNGYIGVSGATPDGTQIAVDDFGGGNF